MPPARDAWNAAVVGKDASDVAATATARPAASTAMPAPIGPPVPAIVSRVTVAAAVAVPSNRVE